MKGAHEAPSPGFTAGAAFARMDTNNDGVISKQEFERGFLSSDGYAQNQPGGADTSFRGGSSPYLASSGAGPVVSDIPRFDAMSGEMASLVDGLQSLTDMAARRGGARVATKGSPLHQLRHQERVALSDRGPHDLITTAWEEDAANRLEQVAVRLS